MSLFSTIYKKELLDSIRDRRAIMVAIFPALIAPVLMAGMFHFMINTQVSTSEITVQIIGKENAPDLIEYMEERDIKFSDYEGNPKEDIKNKDVTMVLEIPEDFEEKFAESNSDTLHSCGWLIK
ncbi:MAG: hypothetical protein HKP09_03245 [Enterobacterales bacterium]|nr:hypothetical protein [Enterobacterales bacterium]